MRWALAVLVFWAASVVGLAPAQPLDSAPLVQAVEAIAGDDTSRTLFWTPGRCTVNYRVWRWRLIGGWKVFEETTDTQLVIPVRAGASERWRVSAVCDDGTEWMVRGGEVVVNPGPWEDALQ